MQVRVCTDCFEASNKSDAVTDPDATATAGANPEPIKLSKLKRRRWCDNEASTSRCTTYVFTSVLATVHPSHALTCAHRPLHEIRSLYRRRYLLRCEKQVIFASRFH